LHYHILCVCTIPTYRVYWHYDVWFLIVCISITVSSWKWGNEYAQLHFLPQSNYPIFTFTNVPCLPLNYLWDTTQLIAFLITWFSIKLNHLPQAVWLILTPCRTLLIFVALLTFEKSQVLLSRQQLWKEVCELSLLGSLNNTNLNYISGLYKLY